MSKFSWYIENYSFANKNTGDYINSPQFKIKWQNDKDAFIRMYPRGRTSNTATIFYLCTSDDSKALDIGTNVALIFTSANFSRKTSLTVNEGNVSNSMLVKNSNLFLRVERKDFDLVRNHPSYEDNIVVECIIQKDGSMELMESYTARTIIRFKQFSYDLPLNASLVTQPSSWMSVQKFLKNVFVGQGNDELKICIDFENGATRNAIVISRASQSDTPLVMFCKLSLCNKERFMCLISGEQFFKDVEDVWKASFDFRNEDKSNVSFLRCELKVSSGKVIYNYNPKTIIFPHQTLEQTSSTASSHEYNGILENMYKNKKFCDIILQVDSEQFPAHKNVLGTASDVFSAMFDSDMIEKKSNIVEISDIEKDTISRLLDFLYTGKMENLELGELINLYSASDKYQILNLKNVCSSELMRKMKKENASEILEIANLHQDNLLEDYVRNFIYTNHREICYTDGWRSLMKRRAELAADVMLQICLLP